MTLRLYLPARQPATLLAPGVEFDLPPGPARHAQVRRAQPGDTLTLFDGQGGEWSAKILQMGRQQVRVRLGEHDPVSREPGLAVTLAVCMPANDRMDWLVEKATELGVHALQPLVSERSVLRLAGERAERKQVHWQGIAVAAAEQSGRTQVPAVHAALGLAPWIASVGPGGSAVRWVLSPQAQTGAWQRPASGAALALSGPEGGLSAAELALVEANGFRPLQLGPRVLRADTAPLALLAVLTSGG